MSVVTVSERSILSAWRKAYSDPLVVRFHGRGRDVEAAADAVRQIAWGDAEVQPGDVLVTDRGLVITAADNPDEQLVREYLHVLARGLEERGIDGKLQTFRSDISPLNNPDSLTPGTELAIILAHDHHEVALSSAVDRALTWCDVPGGEFFVYMGLASQIRAADQAAAVRLCQTTVRRGTECDLTSLRDVEDVRVVSVDPPNYLYLARGGNAVSAEDQFAELMDLARTLAPWTQIGAIRATTRIPCATWGTFNDLTPLTDRELRPLSRAESQSQMADVRGVQILRRPPEAVPRTGDWRVENMADGRILVSAAHLEPWLSPAGPPPDEVRRLRAQWPELMVSDRRAS